MNAESHPFGISQFTTWPQTFEQDLRLYKDEGIPYIEVCEGKLDPKHPELQLERLKEMGLKVSSVQPRVHSLFPDPPRPEPKSPPERVARLKESIKLFGKYFPGTTLVTISGGAPNGDYALAYRTAAKEYKEVAKMAGDHGVRVALEPINAIHMNMDTFLCSIPHAMRVINDVDHPSFGLFVDVWHIWEDAGAVEQIKENGAKIFGVHIDDWKTPRAFGDRHLPGEGEIPLVKLLRAIRSTPYAGAYTLEIFSDLSLPDSLWRDPAGTVRKGKAAFEKLWEKVCA
jgi:sugar phosphate isomerase/epimerase